MSVPKSDLEPGSLNARHRWQYSRFSFGGDQPDSAYGQGMDRIFGEPESKFCQACGLLPSWCECKELKP